MNSTFPLYMQAHVYRIKKQNKKRSFSTSEEKPSVQMSRALSPHGGGGDVASVHWLSASATAVVEGQIAMVVCFKSDAAFLAQLSNRVIQEPQLLPQEGETSSSSEPPLQLGKKQNGGSTGHKKEYFFFILLFFFWTERHFCKFRSHSPPLCLSRAWQRAGTDGRTHRVQTVRLQASRRPQGLPPFNTKAQVTPRSKHVADCSAQSGPDRDTETAGLSVAASPT